jgi:hypothetical protein
VFGVDVEVAAVARGGGTADHVPVHAVGILAVPADLHRELLPVRAQKELLELNGRGVVVVENLVRAGEVDVRVVEEVAARNARHGRVKRVTRRTGGGDRFESRWLPPVLFGPSVAPAAGNRVICQSWMPP